MSEFFDLEAVESEGEVSDNVRSTKKSVLFKKRRWRKKRLRKKRKALKRKMQQHRAPEDEGDEDNEDDAEQLKKDLINDEEEEVVDEGDDRQLSDGEFVHEEVDDDDFVLLRENLKKNIARKRKRRRVRLIQDEDSDREFVDDAREQIANELFDVEDDSIQVPEPDNHEVKKKKFRLEDDSEDDSIQVPEPIHHEAEDEKLHLEDGSEESVDEEDSEQSLDEDDSEESDEDDFIVDDMSAHLPAKASYSHIRDYLINTISLMCEHDI